MRSERRGYWRRIVVGNVIASAVVLVFFSGATWRTPASELVRGYAIAFLFSTCIGPMLGVLMPKIAPWVWSRVRFPFNWVVVSVAMTGLAIAGSVAAIAILILTGYVPTADFGSWVRGSMRIAVAVTLTMGLFITAYEVMRARVAQTAAEAKLASLEARVQPHFLFNTLNSIAALIHEDPQGAERMTGQLASLLRTSLDQQATPLVPLDAELRTVRDYLAIEQVRFGDRLRYAIAVDPGVNGVRVPRMALQTIVENSVKYAVSARREGASLRIGAVAERGATRITLDDDGPGFDASSLPPGHGLALLRDRLSLLFGDRHHLSIESGAAGTRIVIAIPDRPDVAAPAQAPGCEPTAPGAGPRP